jgi:hypothetical protein
MNTQHPLFPLKCQQFILHVLWGKCFVLRAFFLLPPVLLLFVRTLGLLCLSSSAGMLVCYVSTHIQGEVILYSTKKNSTALSKLLWLELMCSCPAHCWWYMNTDIVCVALTGRSTCLLVTNDECLYFFTVFIFQPSRLTSALYFGAAVFYLFAGFPDLLGFS